MAGRYIFLATTTICSLSTLNRPFTVPLFSARLLRTSATGSHLDRPCLKVREITIYSTKGVGDGLETPTPALSVHNNNYKMAASDGKCSILIILRENRAL